MKQYLAAHPGQTSSKVMEEALSQRQSRPDPKKILKLAGIVPKARSRRARKRTEDDIT